MSKFCLVMIVKDEAEVITRAFESLKNIIDSYYISDTGSTDGTPSIIQKWMNEHGIEGEVGSAEWKNFGVNRSILFSEARNHINPLISKAEYYIWLDADEVIITDRYDPLSYPTKKDAKRLYNELNGYKGSFLASIITIFGGVTYERKNICRNDQLYKWEQPVHEYIIGTEEYNTISINWLYDLARKEGNSSRNPERYKKDADMFYKFLEENPGEPRATFYLAQTLSIVDEKEKALEYYIKRSEMESGYSEERYIACLRGGRMTEKRDLKYKLFLRGIEVNPDRLECYYELMMMEYRESNHSKGMMFGMMAPDSRVIKNDFMFSEEFIYQYSFDLHLGVCCYYANRFNLGYIYTKRALNSVIDLDKNIDGYYRTLLESNLTYYIPKIKKELLMD